MTSKPLELIGAFLLGVAVALFAPQVIPKAHAADKNGPSVFADAPLAPARTWSGIWLGVQGGMAAMDTKVDFNDPVTPANYATLDGLSGTGGIFGLGLGFDLQAGPKIVVGVFGDYSWYKDAEFTVSTPLLGPVASGTMALDREWAIGGRLGYLATPSTLVYILAAYSQLEMKALSASIGGTPIGSLAVPTFKGYQLGAGIETRLTDGLYLKGEYRYGVYDAQTVTAVPGFLALDIDPTIHTFRAGLSYKFNAPEVK